MNYQAYLKSKWWLSLREILLPCRCVGCLENDATELHHLNYDALKKEGPQDIIPLCDRCHWLLHQHLKEEFPTTKLSLAVQFTHDVWSEVFSAVTLDESLNRLGWSGKFSTVKYRKKSRQRSKPKLPPKIMTMDDVRRMKRGSRCSKCGNPARHGRKLCRRCKREVDAFS